jgi:tRNA G46 methylase TrmB
VSDSDLRRLYREGAPRAPQGCFSLEDLIEGSGPLELDIGFGRGLSLFERASASPQSRIVGIEVKTKLAYKVSERLQKRDLRNVQILCGDAREILKRSEPRGSVDRVALHFPDPWWKKRHDGFTLASASGYVDDNPFDARSNREKRAVEDGLPVWRILATRD